MTRKNSYSFPPQEELVRIRKKLSNPNYEGGNILISETAPPEEKLKYSVSQSILAYQQDHKLTWTTLTKKMGGLITKPEVYDICRGKLTDFSLGELVIYARNLGVLTIPCHECGGELFPFLWRLIISSLKDLPLVSCKISQWDKHQHSVLR